MQRTSRPETMVYSVMRFAILGMGVIALAFVVFWLYSLVLGGVGSAIGSPDGRYQARIMTRAFLDQRNYILYVAGPDGRWVRIRDSVCGDEIIWSPDSSRMAVVARIRRGTRVWQCQVYSTRNGYYGENSGRLSADLTKQQPKDYAWKWRDSNTVVVFAEYYNAKIGTLTRKPAVVLTVTDTKSGMTVSKKPSP